jgi:cysteine-rich repeat protein
MGRTRKNSFGSPLLALVAAVSLGACGSGTIGGDSNDNSEGVCGNGVVEAAEECDDANQVDGDGCNVDCLNSGVVRWCVEYAHPGGADSLSVHVAVGQERVLAAGRAGLANDPSSTFNSWVMDVELDGSSASDRLVPADGDADLKVRGTALSPDGKAIFVGSVQEPGMLAAAWVGTRSESGMISSQTYSDPDGASASSVYYGVDGPIIVGSVGTRAWVAQLDGAAQIVWEDRFSILEIEDAAADVAQNPDGSIIVVGRSQTGLTHDLNDSPILHGFVRTYSPDKAEVTNQVIAESNDLSWTLSAVAGSALRTVAGGNSHIDITSVGYAWTIAGDTSQLAPAPSSALFSMVHDVALGTTGDAYLVGSELNGSVLVQKIWYFPDLGSGEAGWELTRGSGEVVSVVTAGSYLYTASIVPVAGNEKVAEVCAVSR